MPITYTPLSKVVTTQYVAYLLVLRNKRGRRYYGAILISDGRGIPHEYVYSSAEAPAGFLWPESEVQKVATQSLAHALFDKCESSPLLLVAQSTIGSPAFCQDTIAPTIPFALIEKSANSDQVEFAWVAFEPQRGTNTARLAEELCNRGLLLEPFDRVLAGLREVYPELQDGHDA